MSGCGQTFRLPAPDVRKLVGEVPCRIWPDGHRCSEHVDLGPDMVLHRCECGSGTNVIYEEKSGESEEDSDPDGPGEGVVV